MRSLSSLLFLLALGFVVNVNQPVAAADCPPGMCRSKWGYCGTGPEFCSGGGAANGGGGGSQAGGGGTNNGGSAGGSLNNRAAFTCMFPSAPAGRYQGLITAAQQFGWSPNAVELAAFYGHVAHETDSLKTLEEYCGANGSCATAYNNPSWGTARAAAGKTYFGRGWLQLSWPPNYQAAGRDPRINMDLVATPELVSRNEVLAAKTGIWYFTSTAISSPPINRYAAAGWFSASTNKINGPLECNTGSQNQLTRVKRYQDARRCLGLPPETNMAKASCAGPGWGMPAGVNDASDQDLDSASINEASDEDVDFGEQNFGDSRPREDQRQTPRLHKKKHQKKHHQQPSRSYSPFELDFEQLISELKELRMEIEEQMEMEEEKEIEQ